MALPILATKNIKLVAFLRLKSIHPDQVIKLSRGKAEYHFGMDAVTWEQHKLDFDRSDYLKYAQCLDAVLDLAY